MKNKTRIETMRYVQNKKIKKNKGIYIILIIVGLGLISYYNPGLGGLLLLTGIVIYVGGVCDGNFN